MILWLILACYVGIAEGLAPSFENTLPIDIYVGQLESRVRRLYTLTATDPDGDSFTCTNVMGTVSGAAVAGDEFQFQKITSSGKYEIDVGPPAGGYTLNEVYTCTITCTDGGASSTGVVNIHVKNGQDLYWSNPPATVPKNAATTGADSTLDTVGATDALGESLTYKLVSVTPSQFTSFFDVSSSGVVKNTQSLYGIAYQDATEVFIDIEVTDGVLNMTDTMKITLSGQNWKPTTPTLNRTDDLLESTASGTVLFTLSIDDHNGDTGITVDWNCVPTLANDIVIIDDNYRVKIATDKQLNFEPMPTITCTCIMNDGTHDSDPYFYVINVADDNDPPVIDNTKTYRATMNEGTSGSVDPGIDCTDEDSNNGPEPLSYSISTSEYSNHFDIDSSGIISINGEYDRDGNNPSVVELEVICYDDGNALDNTDRLSATTTVTMTMELANDHTPTCANTVMSATNAMTPGTSSVGTIVTSDDDAGDDGARTCEWSSTSQHQTAYTLTSNCEVGIGQTLTFDYGTQVRYEVIVKDGATGSEQRSSTCTVDIVYSEADTTTTTTTTTQSTATEYQFLAHGANIAMLVMTILAGLALLGLLTYLCLRCCCGGTCGGGNFCDCRGDNTCCRRSPRRTITPEEPPPRERTPVIRKRTPPPRIVTRPQQVQLIRTVGHPTYAYSGMRTLPAGTGFMRSAAGFPPPYVP